jgi:DNA-directed RNA polymerase subunit RPC12/RpoP
MKIKVSLECPECGRRFIDVSELSGTVLEGVCPQCKKKVQVPCDEKHLFNKANRPSKRAVRSA